jgi:hypothetical protein
MKIRKYPTLLPLVMPLLRLMCGGTAKSSVHYFGCTDGAKNIIAIFKVVLRLAVTSNFGFSL